MTAQIVPLPTRTTDRVDATPAIRTPKQYQDAVQALHDIMARNRDRHLSGRGDEQAEAEADIMELSVIGEAIQSSPFVYRKGQVIAKGFLPKVIA